MENIFIKLVNMSIPASWIILIVILLRIMLKRIPRNVFCILWALVAVRLICPVSLESAWSLIPRTEAVHPDITRSYQTMTDSKNPIMNQDMSLTPAEKSMPTDDTGISLIQCCISAATIIWITGMAFLVLYTAVSCFKIHRKISESIVFQDNILLCDYISTPFVWGILHPKIILPSSIKEQHLEHILAHEKAHISRHDHWWKPLGFALLIIYCFNPLVWAAYKFFCRDIELACDEKVIKNYDMTDKKSYSLTLLDCSTKQTGIFTYPLAFGKIGIKERIEAIMRYKKPAFRIIFTAAIVCAAFAVCFLTNPKETEVANANISTSKNDLSSQQPAAERNMLKAHGVLTENRNKEQPAKESQLPEEMSKSNSSDTANHKSGQIWGYITKLGKDTITIDLQNWVTDADEDWKPEYDKDAGFEVVDVAMEDVTYQLSKNCTYSILKHHHNPVVKLSYKKFKQYYQKMEYPVLWVITFDDNQITSIQEQYRP